MTTAGSSQAVVLAAGKGTRMRSTRSKLLYPVLGRPLLEYVLRAVEGADAHPITVVTGHHADSVETACARPGVRFVRQDPPLGTGHALQTARPAFAENPDRTLLVVNGDLPLLRPAILIELLEAHHRDGAAASVLSIVLEHPRAYGRVLRDPSKKVLAIVEERDATPEQRQIREVNAGIYAFHVPTLLRVLDRLRPQNTQGELYLTDLIGLLVADGHAVNACPASDFTELLGVNTLEELAETTRLLRTRRLRELMESGVHVEDPSSTTVDPDAVVESDATLRPFTMIEGHSIVRSGAVVGPYVRLVDSEVGIGSRILDHCLLRECVVEGDASVGPFAHVRPESRIGARARVGNFVELKKTSLGEGSKAPHLSYVGDATIGPSVNIGAGTITCNYDGVDKHPTRIEESAFIGSNTTLVAPVTIGAGAYVGAGSTITEDVPPDALALGRSRQVVKPGWRKRRREQVARARKG